jgi:hypothetical protein
MVNRVLSSTGITLDNFGAKSLKTNEPQARMVGPGAVTQTSIVNGLRVKSALTAH